MKGEANDLHATRWTDDPARQEEFFTEVGPKIDSESRNMARRYGVELYQEDIRSGVRAELWRQMLKKDTDGPFAKDSPKEAADSFLEKKSYEIRELARPLARKEARKQSRQAEILADVRQPDLPEDVETQLFAIAKSIPRIISETPDLTSRESEILRLETLRRSEVDDLAAPIFDQVAQAAGTSGPELRAHVEGHDEQGRLSDSDRKAWSRARAKVTKALTRAALTSLLTIVFALSVVLLGAIRQGRSTHQRALVNQGSFAHQSDLARQDNVIDEDTRAHQDGNG